MARARSFASARDFRRAFASGTRLRSAAITVHVFDRKDYGPARLGMVVPRGKGGAVERNRVRRRLRHAFVASRPPAGLDIAIRAGRGAKTLDFQEMVEALRRAVHEEVPR